MRSFHGSIVITLLLVGCSDRNESNDPLPKKTPPAPRIVESVPDEIRDAPVMVVMSGKMLEMEVDLRRNFMPRWPPEDSPMAALFKIRTTDSSELPPGIRADSAWVIDKDRAWVTSVAGVGSRIADASVLEVVGRGGPEWGPNIDVDVVLQLRDAQGQTCLLQAKEQKIVGAM